MCIFTDVMLSLLGLVTHKSSSVENGEVVQRDSTCQSSKAVIGQSDPVLNDPPLNDPDESISIQNVSMDSQRDIMTQDDSVIIDVRDVLRNVGDEAEVAVRTIGDDMDVGYSTEVTTCCSPGTPLDPDHDREPGTSLVCNLCNAKFTKKSNLTRHMRKHTGNLFECEVCQKKEYSKYALDIHIKTTHQGELFVCRTDGCYKMYKTTYGRRMHESTHTNTEKFLCATCGDRFAYKSTYDSHVAKHEGIKPFSCGKCDKTFTHSSHLSTHKGICQLTTQPFKCQDCSRRFKSTKYLREHTKIHSDPESFICSKCASCFNSRGGLFSHMKRKHNN